MATNCYNHNGVNHPLADADYDTAFKVYKTDKRRAIVGDPAACIEAMGLRRLPNVEFAHIGSGGQAYIGFKDKKSKTGVRVRRFLIPVAAQKVRDAFDVRGSASTQVLMLKTPPASQTMSNLKAVGKKWRADVKNGKEVKGRGPQKNGRIARLGVSHRPRPNIVKGQVSMPLVAPTEAAGQ